MHMKVRDVMSRQVVSVNGSTPFRDVAEVLYTHAVSAVPVVDGEGHVLGVVSEADLLHKEEFREQFYGEGYRPPLRVRLRERICSPGGDAATKARGETAAQLMTAPAITARPYTSAVSAARLMSEHGVKRLPVVDDEGRLEGVVSRTDLLKTLVRSDEEVAREIRDDIVEGALWADTSHVHVSVADAVVTLSGTMPRRGDVLTLVRMTERVNGVIDVVDRLSWERDDTLDDE
jgi:CBS-domain-containing membrane protein